jgi:hypothetical protein
MDAEVRVLQRLLRTSIRALLWNLRCNPIGVMNYQPISADPFLGLSLAGGIVLVADAAVRLFRGR